MDAIEAIRERRMLPKVDPERRPSPEEIAELLELGTRAPNHHLTEPWRFTVLTGEGLERLSRCIAADAAEGSDDSPEDLMDLARRKAERAPVVIAVSCVPSDDEKVVEQEELASVAMALQNLLLAAYAKGLGAMLRTGGYAYHPSVRRELDLQEDERVVGFVFLGYPAGDREKTARTPASELTRWIGWD